MLSISCWDLEQWVNTNTAPCAVVNLNCASLPNVNILFQVGLEIDCKISTGSRIAVGACDKAGSQTMQMQLLARMEFMCCQ